MNAFKLTLSLILSSFYVSGVQAGNFGRDDRVDTVLASNLAQNLAESVPALIKKERIKKISDNIYQLHGMDLRKIGLCPNEKFSEEKQIANCSGSLITSRHVLTAAHCIDDIMHPCSDYRIVFGYARPLIPLSFTPNISADQIYHCKNVIHHKFDMFGEDLAIIELDREVLDKPLVSLKFRPNLKLADQLTLIGYPLGISQKVVEIGQVLNVDQENVTFKHNLDTFSSNSGGPIFNQSGEQVGVLVRSSVSNLKRLPGAKCDVWGMATQNDFAEGNSLETIKKIFESL